LDFKKLSRGEQMLGISALVLIVFSFFPLWGKFEINAPEGFEAFEDTDRFGIWSSAEVGGFNTSIGYGFMAKLAIILALVALVFVILKAAGVSMQMPVPWGQIYVGLAGLSLLLLLITILTGPEGGDGELGIEVSRGFGLFIGTALAAVMAYGGWMHMQQEGSAPSPTTTPPPESPPPPAS
jgi:hypothetical protein